MAHPHPSDLASERVVALVDQLRSELAGARGWQIEAARRLGISESLLSKVAAGQRTSFSRGTIDRICHALQLDKTYFEVTGNPDYRDYLTGSATPTAPPTEALPIQLAREIVTANSHADPQRIQELAHRIRESHLWQLADLVTRFPGERSAGIQLANELIRLVDSEPTK